MKRLTPLFTTLLSTLLVTQDAHAWDIPGLDVDGFQVTVNDGIRAVLNASASGDEGPAEGIHWRVDFEGVGVLNENPTVTCAGDNCANFLALLPSGFELAISAPVDVRLHGDTKVNSWWSPEINAEFDIHQVVGVTIRAPISPALELGEVSVDLMKLDGNVEVNGLERSGAKLGTLVGGFGLGVGFGVGAGLGAIAGHAAEKPIKRAIEDAFAKQLEGASRSAAEALNEYLGNLGLSMREDALSNGAGGQVANYSQFDLQTGSALHETGDDWAFALADNGKSSPM